MTTAADSDRFESLVAEYWTSNETLGPLWVEITLETVRRVCRQSRFDVKYYTHPPAASWNEDEIQVLAQDVIVEKLLSKAQLDWIVHNARDLRSVRALLRQNTEQVLYDRLAESAVRNLVDRFLKAQGKGRIPTAGDPLPSERVQAAAALIWRLPRAPNRGSKRLPKVFTGKQVRDVLPELLEATGRQALGRTELFAILNMALPTFLAAPQFESIDEPFNQGDDGDEQWEQRWADESALALGNPDVGSVTSEAVAAALDRLDRPERDVLRNLLRDRDDPQFLTQQQMAVKLGHSDRQTVASLVGRIRSVLGQVLDGIPEDLHCAVIEGVGQALGGSSDDEA